MLGTKPRLLWLLSALAPRCTGAGSIKSTVWPIVINVDLGHLGLDSGIRNSAGF